MKNLIFCLNLYDEEDMLPACLQSIRKYYPDAKIVAVDGAYESFVKQTIAEINFKLTMGQNSVAKCLERFTVPVSTDRTLEILKDFGVETIIECKKSSEGNPLPWPSEVAKRSQYFVGKDGDYYFILDGDERVVGSIAQEKLTEDAYTIMLKRDDDTVPYKVLRIFKHQDGIHYEGAHHALWVGDRLHTKNGIFNRMSDRIGDIHNADGVLVEHCQTQRTKLDPIRNMAKGAYYRHLTSCEEAAFRAQYRL